MIFYDSDKVCRKNFSGDYVHIRADSTDKPSMGEMVIVDNELYTVSHIINNYDKSVIYVMLDKNIKKRSNT